jgi:hypothetical protein
VREEKVVEKQNRMRAVENDEKAPQPRWHAVAHHGGQYRVEHHHYTSFIDPVIRTVCVLTNLSLQSHSLRKPKWCIPRVHLCSIDTSVAIAIQWDIARGLLESRYESQQDV